jgi:magnesium chelatase accessory protein
VIGGQGKTHRRPTVLLLHGTGASTHSWRALAPLLARRCTVVALDLPGHGFTGTPAEAEGFSLPAVASGISGDRTR